MITLPEAFEQEMKFINIEPGRFMLAAVSGNTVPHRILHNEKSDLF